MKAMHCWKQSLNSATRFVLLGTLAAAQYSTVVALPIEGLSNSGVDDIGQVLPLHAVEQHYAVSGMIDVAYVVPEVFYPWGGRAWVAAPAGSAWIGGNVTDNTYPADAVGIYHYFITFDLTEEEVPEAQIAGSWATDNTGEIWLNGVYTGWNKDLFGYRRLDGFLISSGFVGGLNTLEFRVENVLPPPSPNPSGLLVTGLIGEIGGNLTRPDDTPPIPEPFPETGGTAILLLLALLGIGFARSSWRASWKACRTMLA